MTADAKRRHRVIGLSVQLLLEMPVAQMRMGEFENSDTPIRPTSKSRDYRVSPSASRPHWTDKLSSECTVDVRTCYPEGHKHAASTRTIANQFVGESTKGGKETGRKRGSPSCLLLRVLNVAQNANEGNREGYQREISWP